MPARRRMYPDRAPARGISGTPAAYDCCARPGCGDARVKHTSDGRCTAAKYFPVAQPWGGHRNVPGTCSCTGFTESEE